MRTYSRPLPPHLTLYVSHTSKRSRSPLFAVTLVRLYSSYPFTTDDQYNLMVGQMDICGFPANVLFNPTSALNSIYRSFVDKYDLKEDTIENMFYDRGFGNLCSTGVFGAPISVGKHLIETDFIVNPDIPGDPCHAIIGMKWLKEHKAVIDIVKKTIVITLDSGENAAIKWMGAEDIEPFKVVCECTGQISVKRTPLVKKEE